MMKLGRSTIAIVALLLGFFFVSSRVQAQTQTTGDIAGAVTDQTGGVVPGAMVTLKDVNKGNTKDSTTNARGEYHFFLLSPGPYVVTVGAPGFQTVDRALQVNLGQVATGDIQLTLGAASQTVTVTEQAPLLKTENGDAGTTLDEQQVQELPNSGNDMGYTATLAPGVVANTTGGGLGNFSSFGQSAVSNLFTINGMDDNDPFLNLANTGATNLMLGNNEVEEMSVVQNGYSVAYGGLAGAQINVVTGAGTNQFHGRATYEWNGRLLNANNYFNNFNNGSGTAVPRPFVNANQWAANIGGPIIKNHLFWYFNTEGIYLVVPSSQTVFIPTDGVRNATEANIASIYGPASPEAAFYKKMFDLWDGASGRAGATAVAGGGCDGTEPNVNAHLPSGTMHFGDPTAGNFQACQLQLQSSLGNLTHDWYFDGRIDWVVTSNDKVYTRIKKEHGVQASYTDAINPAFNFGSDQPEWDGQFQWTHAIGATAVNQFNASGQWYAATFNNADHAASLGVFPTTLIFASGAWGNPFGTSLGGIDFDFPQGRNVTQYQIGDDFSKTMGNHTLKAGVKFHRSDVSDLDNGVNNSGQLVPFTFDAFFMGGSDPLFPDSPIPGLPNTSELIQSFAQVAEFPVASYTFGGYIEDDWKVKPNLTLTLGIRLEHQSNPICVNKCFAAPVVQFTSLDHSSAIPYNQAIQTGRQQAVYSLTSINPEPRFGFAWSPGKLRDTVIRGGFGLFYDTFPGVVVDNFAQNPPLFNQFTVFDGELTPGVPASLFTAAGASNSAFVGGFESGATLADLNTLVPGFTPPAITSATTHTKTTQVQKWSLEVQHSFGANTSLTVGYVGNHADNLPYFNNGLNVFADGFTGIPTSPADERFGVVTQIYTNATSNYNGVFLSFLRRFGASQFTLNYTYGRALDYSSNSGNPNVTFQNSQFGAANTSVSFPEDPFHMFRYNYGPADYDVTHYFSANYIWQLPVRRMLMGHGWSRLVDGWQVSGTIFARSGLPYTLVDGGTSTALGGTNYGVGEDIFGTQLAKGTGFSCALTSSGIPKNICLNPSDYTGSPAGFGNVTRNSLRGPNYFNTDFNIMKYTKLPKWESAEVGLGVEFYNFFNHPNFQQPIGDVSSVQFGQVISTVSPATSIYGSGLGADSSPRLIQLKAQFRF